MDGSYAVLLAPLLISVTSPAGEIEPSRPAVRAAVEPNIVQRMRAFAEQDTELPADPFTSDGR
ncbi:MAG: hypothetical protein GF399_09420 [Candidatus Coatesbacteria bacterium]|nr:hypothetical protein [Candidatus Coatesbacteria bacterium]